MGISLEWLSGKMVLKKSSFKSSAICRIFCLLLTLSNSLEKTLFSLLEENFVIFFVERVLKNKCLWILDWSSSRRNLFLLNRILKFFSFSWNFWRRVLLWVSFDKHLFIPCSLSHWDELPCHFWLDDLKLFEYDEDAHFPEGSLIFLELQQ